MKAASSTARFLDAFDETPGYRQPIASLEAARLAPASAVADPGHHERPSLNGSLVCGMRARLGRVFQHV